MRISMVLPDQYADRPDELAQRQRRREIAYQDRRECDVKIGEPGVFDESDQPDPANILAVAKDKCVVGYAYPLPATGQAMPERSFLQLLTRGALNGSEIENFVSASIRICPRAGQGTSFVARHSPCPPASSSGRERMDTIRSSPPPIRTSSAFFAGSVLGKRHYERRSSHSSVPRSCSTPTAGCSSNSSDMAWNPRALSSAAAEPRMAKLMFVAIRAGRERHRWMTL